MSQETWVDAHHHLWRYRAEEYPWMSDRMATLQRDFSQDDLLAVSAELGVISTVAVQARQTTAETEWLLEEAAHGPLVAGVVGWAPLTEPHVEGYLERWKKNKALKGLRHVLHDEEDDFYMLREDFNRGLSALKQFNLVYDILIFERHLPQTIELVDRHPHQVFVVDHIAKPRIRERRFEEWSRDLHKLAERPNVFCKVSGMVTEADWDTWSSQELRPYLDHVVDAFTPARLMFGSDWPVLNVASGYRRWLRTVASWIESFSTEEKFAIRRGTAESVYRLGL